MAIQNCTLTDIETARTYVYDDAKSNYQQPGEVSIDK